MHSGLAIGGAKEKATTEPLIWKVAVKQEGLDLQKEKETFVTACKDFNKDEAPMPKVPANLRTDDEVKPFLQACMKLLCNKKVVENLQALIDSCADKPNPPPKVKDVHKLYKHKKHTGREMRLMAQIGDYEMDQVILDVGSDANVLPKQT